MDRSLPPTPGMGGEILCFALGAYENLELAPKNTFTLTYLYGNNSREFPIVPYQQILLQVHLNDNCTENNLTFINESKQVHNIGP